MKKISLLVILSFLVSLSLFAAPVTKRGRCTPSKEFCIYFTPDDLPVEVLHTYLKSAKKSIRIAAYNTNVEGVGEILLEKLNAGVKVEFLADYKLTFESNKTWNALPLHENLLRVRLPVMRGGNPQMHNKMIFIDGKTLLIGSANWTYQGVVGNYENVFVTTNESIIKKFSEEADELKAVALAACNLFAKNCDTKSEGWDEAIHSFLTTGNFAATDLAPKLPGVNGCRDLLKGKGLLGVGNQRSIMQVERCLKDPRYATLVEEISKIEHYVDGMLVTDDPDTTQHFRVQRTPYKVYFSPEDNIQRKILAELYSTLDNPTESFVYVTTNFITNRFIASALSRIKAAGVRVRVFFDRSRYEDPDFGFALDLLKDLGFKTATTGTYDDLITVFDNRISGSFGMNHNKTAIVGNGKSVKLVSGSANWSAGAMSNNDENILVIEDEAIVSIFLKEMVSQLFVYRYGQNLMLPEMQDEITYLTGKSPCLSMHLGMTASCTIAGKSWGLKPYSSSVITLVEPAINVDTERAWFKLTTPDGKSTLNKLYSYRNFDGHWVSSIALPLNSKVKIKFLKVPKEIDPNLGTSQITWDSAEHEFTNSSLAIETIPGPFKWNN